MNEGGTEFQKTGSRQELLLPTAEYGPMAREGKTRCFWVRAETLFFYPVFIYSLAIILYTMLKYDCFLMRKSKRYIFYI